MRVGNGPCIVVGISAIVEIEVRVNQRGMQARARRSYAAPAAAGDGP